MKKISLLTVLFSGSAFAGSFYPIDEVGRGFTIIETYPALGLVLVAEEGGFPNKMHGINEAPWGVDRIEHRELPLDGKYNFKGDSSVTAYIVDTGIQPQDEFKPNLAEGFDATKSKDGTNDCHGHGTHVAGTVGSLSYGVAYGTTLVPVKVFGCGSTTSTQIILRGLNYVAEKAKLPAVVNMSLGGSLDAALDSAAETLISKGIHVVVAAGNSYGDACDYSPSNLGKKSAILTVGATNVKDSIPAFSNTGTCVNLYAPGEDIESVKATGGSTKMNGTSMASPHAAGAVALYLAKHAESKPEETKKYFIEHATSGVLKKSGKDFDGKLLFVENFGKDEKEDSKEEQN